MDANGVTLLSSYHDPGNAIDDRQLVDNISFGVVASELPINAKINRAMVKLGTVVHSMWRI